MKQQGAQSMTIDDLAIIVKAGFDDVAREIGEIRSEMATKDDLTREIGKLRSEMATKDDLTREIGKLRSDMIDYIAKQNMELRGDLVVLMRGEDRKLFTLVEIMVEKNLLSKTDANRVTKLEPFP